MIYLHKIDDYETTFLDSWTTVHLHITQRTAGCDRSEGSKPLNRQDADNGGDHPFPRSQTGKPWLSVVEQR